MKAISIFFYIGLLTLFCQTTSHATTLYSIGSGAWSSTAIWSLTPGGASCGCTPVGTDNITIAAGTTVTGVPFATLSGSLTVNGTLSAPGPLQVASGATLVVNNSFSGPQLQIANGATVTVNSSSFVSVNTFINNSVSLTAVNISGVMGVSISYLNSGYLAGTGFIAVPPASVIGSHDASLIIMPPLPIELIAFGYKNCSEKIELFWEISGEVKSESFLVERSFDGTNFSLIATVNAEKEKLFYSIYEPHFTTTVYYRLKKADGDGGTINYQIIEVRSQLLNETPIELYPNPSTGIITIERKGTESLKVSVWDFQGNLFLNKTIEAYENKIDLSELKKGIYFIQLNSGKENGINKIILE